jgi:magnesium-transporting ATPase (P-type)
METYADTIGLSAQEVQLRRQQYGRNSLPRPRSLPVWRRLISQLTHFFAIMLWIAGLLAIFAGMPQLGLAIFVVIVLNGMFAFVQEYRAERAGERLRDLLPQRAMVVREGDRQRVEATELVPDDVVILSAGDRISADMRVMNVHGLSVDTSALTGESIPATPQVAETVFAGTFVLEGEATAIVIATGEATRLASLTRLTVATQRPRSPLALELDRVVRIIALFAMAVGSVFLAIAFLVGIRLADAFLFALGVMVALVPEGLLPTVTFSLALGAQRIANLGALIRRLESVETLGSTTIICTDKTGTLTRNEMSVVEVWTGKGRALIEGTGYNPAGNIRIEPELLPALQELASAGARHLLAKPVLRDGRWVAQGNPLEAALVVFARRLQVDLRNEESASPAIRRFAFDPRRRRASVVAGQQVLVRGAPEAVLERCRETYGAHGVVGEMASRGLRVIAIAVRSIERAEALDTAELVEQDLTLLGLIGIEDPPRSEVAASISACRKAGIRVAMVTGDHSGTARAIAQEVGLSNTDGRVRVIEGKDLPEDEDLLGALVDSDGIVISRVSPEDKLRIARALRKRGHVVAMTGDGVNDAPALHEANIGVAMGLSGTDVAREAADLVLLDDNFATIVAAIEQGRTTFANARRFLTYHLTDNIAELTPFGIWALSGGRFPLALSVLQVLCLDIGTDILPAVALGAEPSKPRIMDSVPNRRRLVDRSTLFRSFGVLGLTEAIIEMAAFLSVFWFEGWRPGMPFSSGGVFLSASGAAFSAVVLGQMANAFVCRSTRASPQELGWFSNRYLVMAVCIEAIVLLCFLYVPPVAGILGHTPPSAAGYLTALLAIPAVFAADASHKWWRRIRRSRGLLM